MINHAISTPTNSSPRSARTDTPLGGITVNLNLVEKLPGSTTEVQNNILTPRLYPKIVEDLHPKLLQDITPRIQEAKPKVQEINISQFTENTKDCNCTRVDFVWPVSSSIKPIKKKAVRLKPAQPIILRPFASLINTEDAVTMLRKLQFF